MKYLQYKTLIEWQYQMKLKKVMYEICVEEDLNADEGSKKLGIAKEIFIYWRSYYRFNKGQLLFDEVTNDLTISQSQYIDKLKDANSTYPVDYGQETSLDELEGMLKRKIECLMFHNHRINDSTFVAEVLPFYEFSQEIIRRYRTGTLQQEVENMESEKPEY